MDELQFTSLQKCLVDCKKQGFTLEQFVKEYVDLNLDPGLFSLLYYLHMEFEKGE